MRRTAWISFAASSLFLGCSQSSSEPIDKPHRPEVKGEFRTKTYPISESEHVLIMDLPNRVMPTRCMVYVNESTKTTHMHCDDDGTGTASDLPAQGAELER